VSAAPVIEALEQALSEGHIDVQGTKKFNELNASYLLRFESDIGPAAIVLLEAAEDVSMIVKTVKSFVINSQTIFAIGGASQQPLPGYASIEGSITLDLALLTGIEIDLDNYIVLISAGECWGAVYKKLSKHRRGITGSRSAKGGIGGLAMADENLGTPSNNPLFSMNHSSPY